MARGFQVNELAEHAAEMELAAALAAWHSAENAARHTAQRALDQGVRSHVVAAALGMTRRTFYRWMASDFY